MYLWGKEYKLNYFIDFSNCSKGWEQQYKWKRRQNIFNWDHKCLPFTWKSITRVLLLNQGAVISPLNLSEALFFFTFVFLFDFSECRQRISLQSCGLFLHCGMSCPPLTCKIQCRLGRPIISKQSLQRQATENKQLEWKYFVQSSVWKDARYYLTQSSNTTVNEHISQTSFLPGTFLKTVFSTDFWSFPLRRDSGTKALQI